MADFATFGRAVAVALGQTGEAFDRAYRANRNGLNDDIVEDAVLAKLICHLATEYCSKDPWIGSLTGLTDELKRVAKQQGISLTKSEFPGSTRWLSSVLSELSEPLRTRGVIVKQLDRRSDCRPWLISESPAELSMDNATAEGRIA